MTSRKRKKRKNKKNSHKLVPSNQPFSSEILPANFFKVFFEKIKNHWKAFRQLFSFEFTSQLFSLKALLFLVVLNVSIWGWLNEWDIFLIYRPLIKEIKEVSFPIALGKMEEGVILGAEDAVKINDLQKESVAKNSLQKALGAEKNLKLSLMEGSCQRNKLEGKSSELCGQDGKDEVLDQELKKIDDQSRVRTIVRPRNPAAGKGHCAAENDHPSYSDTKGKHMDEDCCPDPDERPNPRCYYSASGYKLMLKR